MKTYKKLKFVELREFDLWDIKRYTSEKLKSTFNIEKLSNCIKEENRKYKLYLEEDKTFGILGVNNKDGIFDAYEQKGKEINQPYKKMEIGWLAYNPYRINVGSIGIRKKEHLYQYISPAYVVFSCLDNLLPEYLYLLFRTERFIKIINESTTGSVRQNLTSEILKTLEIPLPPLSDQETIVKNYCDKITQATTYEQQAETLEKKIESYLFESLGIEELDKRKKIGLNIIESKRMERWDIPFLMGESSLKSKYSIHRMGEYIVEIATGTTPPTSRKEYFRGDINFYTPSDINNKILLNADRKVSLLAVKDKKVRVFKKNTLLFVGIGSTVGKVGIIGNEFATSNQQITGFNVDENMLLTEYVYYYFTYFKNVTTKEQTKATLPIVNQEKIMNILIPIPPKETQQAIIKQIDTYKNEIKILRERATLLKQQAEQEFEQTIFS